MTIESFEMDSQASSWWWAAAIKNPYHQKPFRCWSTSREASPRSPRSQLTHSPRSISTRSSSLPSLIFSLSLLFRLQVSLADGGNYSCQPASLPRASTTLHVLKVIIFILMAIDWYCCPDGEETEDSGEAFDNQWSSRPDLDQDQRISSHCFTSLPFHMIKMINMWS